MDNYLSQLRAIDAKEAHQKTIDVIRDTITYLDSLEKIESDELEAINKAIYILLDVFNPDFTHDIELLVEMDNIIFEWRAELIVS